MKLILGPLPKDKIILCSADASPNSQGEEPAAAAHFFPNAPWVGAIRNLAENLNCNFYILTTGHGLVSPDEIITPYDAHILEYRQEVKKKWKETIPNILKMHKDSLIIFYAGGCPRDSYLEISKQFFRSLGISILSFGRPMMVDINKIEECVRMLSLGTTLTNIQSILREPDRLEFYYHTSSVKHFA